MGNSVSGRLLLRTEKQLVSFQNNNCIILSDERP